VRTKRKCRYADPGDCNEVDAGMCSGILKGGRCSIATQMTKDTRAGIEKDMKEVSGNIFKVWDVPSAEFRVRQLLGNGNMNLFCKRADIRSLPEGKFKPGELKAVINTDARRIVVNVLSIGEVKSGDFKGYWRIVVRSV